MIIVNMSSTAEDSTATYQCRDGPTVVYTTQCTSTGVWNPHPWPLNGAIYGENHVIIMRNPTQFDSFVIIHSIN